MKVALAHASFMLYWPPRLRALDELLRAQGSQLNLIEVSSHAGPYDFSPMGSHGWDPDRHQRLFEGVRVESLNPRDVAQRMWDALEAIQPDVVVSGAIAFTPGAVAVRWAATRKRGVVVMDSARLEDVPRPPWVNAVKRRFYANVNAVLIPAPSHAPTYEKFGILRERIFYGVTAIDNEFFSKRVEQYRAADTRTINTTELPHRYFLGIGRQVAKKNWDMVIAAYAEYRRQAGAGAWDLVLIGDGPEHDRLVEQARVLGVAGIRFLPFVKPEEAAIAYANAGGVVLASFYGETWGLVINEAMASGLPVLVSTECGCAASLVDPGVNGWTFSPHVPRELTQAMERLAGIYEGAATNIAERSREIVRHWSIDHFAQSACSAIGVAAKGKHGFAAPIDRLLLKMWKGRFRPT